MLPTDAMVTAACKAVFAHDDAQTWPDERDSIREGLASALSVMASEPEVRELVMEAIAAEFGACSNVTADAVLSVLAGEGGER